jgi:molybdopterin/thiamine biosynthesis adenylyltransferase
MNYDFQQLYARHLCLPEVGKIGQEKLLKAKVLVIGAGGIGSSSLFYLTASGIGEIGIIDQDKITLSNLSRQILFERADVGSLKVDAAKQSLSDLNPNTKINLYGERFSETNAKKLVSKYDIILDGSDNIETRYLANLTCFKAKKPLISASCERFRAHIYIFRYQKNTGCYNCLYPNLSYKDTFLQNCEQNGIFSPTAGLAGLMQASFTIKEIIGLNHDRGKNFFYYDMLQNSTKNMVIKKDGECSVCGGIN